VDSGLVTYQHNGQGQRVSKDDGAQTLFAYDEAGMLIGEYDSLGVAIQETVYFNGAPVAALEGTNKYFVHTDHLGTPRVITDGNTVIWRWESDPFGTTPAQEDPDGDSTLFTYNLRFPGQYFDMETGQHYNYFRDYDSTLGRYMESDPIGLNGGTNPYVYVANNPVIFVDPLGLVKWKGTASVIALTLGGGAARYTFDLLSECVNGKQVKANVVAGGPIVGFGIKLSGTSGSIEFEDGNSEPDAFVFEGTATFVGAGGALGGGLGLSAIQLGGARSIGGGFVKGLDLSVFGGAGISRVVGSSEQSCDDCQEVETRR